MKSTIVQLKDVKKIKSKIVQSIDVKKKLFMKNFKKKIK